MGTIGMLMTLLLHNALPRGLREGPTLDLYFDADICWYLEYLTTPPAHIFQSIEHPFLRWLLYPIARFFTENFHASDWAAVGLIMGINAFAWTALLYLVLLKFSEDHLASVALTLLALSSAAAVFWLPVPESFPFGSTSVLLTFALPRLRRKSLEMGAFAAGQLLTVAFVVTDWLGGILATAAAIGRRPAAAVTVAVLGVLSIAVFEAMSRDEPRYGGSLNYQEVVQKYRSFPNTAQLATRVADFFLTPLSPRKLVYTETTGEHWAYRQKRIVSTRRWGPGHFRIIEAPSDSVQLVGYLAWSLLLLAALIRAVWTCRSRPTVLAALLFLVFQFFMHIKFGEIMFLYCLGWMPFFLMLVAHLVRTRYRRWALAAVLLITAVNLRTNLVMYYECNKMIEGSISGTLDDLEFAGPGPGD